MTFPFFWSALLELEAGWLAGEEAEGALPVGVAGAPPVEEEEGGREGGRERGREGGSTCGVQRLWYF